MKSVEYTVDQSLTEAVRSPSLLARQLTPHFLLEHETTLPLSTSTVIFMPLGVKDSV